MELGPFACLHDIKTAGLSGNAEQHSLSHITVDPESALSGMHVIYLGSSVTYGGSAKGVSFADYITVHNGMTMTKEAVSGTTMVDDAPDSYISRMKRLDKNIAADLLVCQLSTNDASQKKPLGTVSTSHDMRDFNTHAIAGSIETIITYAQDTWHCPVVFYTNTRYASEAYGDMMALLYTIAEKWNVPVIDLWSNDEMNAITDAQRTLWMADNIHPMQAGYQEWWMPVMEAALTDVFVSE